MGKMNRKNHKTDDSERGGSELKQHPEGDDTAIPAKKWQEAENASPDDFDDGVGEPGESYEPGERREDKDEG